MELFRRLLVLTVYLVVGVGVSYELAAAVSQMRHKADATVTRYPTISNMVTGASRRFPWLKWLVLGLSVLLLLHFFWGLWA